MTHVYEPQGEVQGRFSQCDIEIVLLVVDRQLTLIQLNVIILVVLISHLPADNDCS